MVLLYIKKYIYLYNWCKEFCNLLVNVHYCHPFFVLLKYLRNWKAASISESSWYCPVMISGPQSFHCKANKMDMLNRTFKSNRSRNAFFKAFNLGKRDWRREAAAAAKSALIHQAYPKNREKSVQLSMTVFRILYSSNSGIFGRLVFWTPWEGALNLPQNYG